MGMIFVIFMNRMDGWGHLVSNRDLTMSVPTPSVYNTFIFNAFCPCLMDASVETCTPVICFESQSRELNGGLHDTLQDAICFLHKQMEPLYSCYSTPPFPFHTAHQIHTHSFSHTLCSTLDMNINPKPIGSMSVWFSA